MVGLLIMETATVPVGIAVMEIMATRKPITTMGSKDHPVNMWIR